MSRTAALVLCAVALSLPASAQPRRSYMNDDCGGSRRQAVHCEIREATMGGVNPIDVDAGQNGGIQIRGWDRADVHVRAKIQAYADTDAEARALASAVEIEATGTTVRASGPSGGERGDNQHWSVSFEISVPRTGMVTLKTVNGGIAIEDFRGTAKFRASNGGVSLRNVGGDISGQTTNGGLSVDLDGDRWDGAGLDVETHNGGVRMSVPDGGWGLGDGGWW